MPLYGQNSLAGLRASLRQPKAAGFIASIAQLPAGALWTADTGSVNHWIEFDAGLVQQLIFARYVDPANLIRTNNSDQVNATSIQGVQRIAGTDNFNVPGTTTLGVTTQSGDRWRYENANLTHQFKLLRAGVVIFQTAVIGAGSVGASTFVAKLPASTVVTNNVAYGVL